MIGHLHSGLRLVMAAACLSVMVAEASAQKRGTISGKVTASAADVILVATNQVTSRVARARARASVSPGPGYPSPGACASLPHDGSIVGLYREDNKLLPIVLRSSERDREPYPRDFVQQPPLIPHRITGYTITAEFNRCMECHAWSRAPDTGATKVSQSHFKDRDGRELSNISPRRYFCLQCHVSQTEAPPLVKNTFQPLPAVKQAPAK